MRSFRELNVNNKKSESKEVPASVLFESIFKKFGVKTNKEDQL